MPERAELHARTRRSTWLALAVLVAGCASPDLVPTPTRPADAKALMTRLMPDRLADRAGWATDLYAAFAAQGIEPTQDRVCAVLAVIEQESGYRVDPVVPGLGPIALKEIDQRASSAGVPPMLVHAALRLDSSNGRTYLERIESARTERELSDTFEDLIGRVPLGKTLFGSANPIRTRGPMQVNVSFIQRYAASHPYPYPAPAGANEEAFTRRGGLYFGVAHLLDYPAAYDRMVHRFADFNAGQYASRNAAFQQALTSASGIPVTPDGALLPGDSAARNAGSTELAVGVIARRLEMGPAAIRRDLEQGKVKGFESTDLYQKVYALAERNEGRALPRAAIPQIQLSGPKISRNLSTAWYAGRVDERYQRCLAR